MTRSATTDAVLNQNEALGLEFDLALDDEGDILTNDFFDTALLVSVFSDKRALESEVFEPERRSGWIGNEFTPGFEIGSKLWLYKQSRLTADVINSMISVVNESLQWMIDDNLAIAVSSSVLPINGRVILTIIIQRPNSKVEKRLFELWENSGVTVRAED